MSAADKGIPAFEDDPVAMALGLTPRKPGVLIPGEPDHCHLCALDTMHALRAELDGLRVRTLTLDQRCREASMTLLGVGAALARMGWLAADDDLSDQGHDNLLRYVRTIKGVVDVLSIGEAERQEKARIERRRVAGETGDTPQ